MKMRWLSPFIPAILFVVCFPGGGLSQPREDPRIVVSLKIKTQIEQEPMLAWLDFFRSDVSRTKNSKRANAPGGTAALVRLSRELPDQYRIVVDSEDDGDLTNDPTFILAPNSSVDLMVKRRWGKRQQFLPYTITLLVHARKDKKPRPIFYWRPKYRAEGTLKIKDCECSFVMLDINGDGTFDRADFSRGTTIGLDRNNDGRIWGRDEWLMGSRIIEFCGLFLVIDHFRPDGSEVTLVETSLRIPKLGDTVPPFLLTTLNGKYINSNEFRGRIILLDFWASWCKPCIEKFSDLEQLDQEFSDQIKVILINVDERARLKLARQISRKHKLRWPQVMSGKGEDDIIWKIFNGVGGNQFIPLYVLIDQEGKIRYVDSGGIGLSEVRLKIGELLKR